MILQKIIHGGDLCLKCNHGKFQMPSGKELSLYCQSSKEILTRSTSASLVVGASDLTPGRRFPALSMCCAPVVSGKRYPRSSLVAPVQCTSTSLSGVRPVYSKLFGVKGWLSMTRWRG